MNRTITTTSITRRRRSLRHAALALCAVLVALVAASCTADALDGTDPGAPSGNTNPDDVLTFAVGPRPGFTEVTTTRADGFSVQEIAGQARNDKKSARNSAVIPGLTRDLPNQSTAPATRAELTDDGTHWETGDILWLRAYFYQDKQGFGTPNAIYTSALKYDGNKWRYLTVAEAEDLNTGNISRFSRLLRWPRESADWVDPSMEIYAWYVGSGKPDADGKLTIIPEGEIPTTPVIGGRAGMCSPDMKSVPLELTNGCSRVRIPANCTVELTGMYYWPELTFNADNLFPQSKQITEIPARSEDTDVFLILNIDANPTAKLTRDNVSCTFTFPKITDAEGNLTWDGASYTLTPYTSGTETPVADYDLTIADEAGLRAFAQAVNAGDRLPNGKPAAEARVLQTANIHLTQGEWVPIGIGGKRFRGAYNGNGHDIKGLTITTMPQPTADKWSNAGLFGYAEGAVLTGITLREVGINIPQGDGVNHLRVGSIAGYIESSTLSLCSAAGTMNASNERTVQAGGITGENTRSTISRCRTDIEIKATSTGRGAYAGGISGHNVGFSFILSCEAQGAQTADGSEQACAGGITAYNETVIIAFCRMGANTVMALKGTNMNYAGGLVGYNLHGYLYSCYSRATVKGSVSPNYGAGAIAGYSTDRIQHCYATGATGQGTSNVSAVADNIVYNIDPKDGDIHRLMTGYTGKVESLTGGGKTYYPFTTSYAPSATPAYGIIPQRAVWTSDGAWNMGDGKYPALNIEAYEGK